MIKRGEIYYANLNPTRPVLIVSNNANNKMASTVTVIPITSNTKRVYPFEVLLEMEDSGLPKVSKAQCHQTRTISKLRIKDIKPTGQINHQIMLRIYAALKIHLDFQ